MQPFDLLGPLPAPRSTTVLEASAGTGKTYALAGLVTRFVAEGAAKLDEMLLITFSRAATRELRERVRAQLVKTVAALDDPPDDADDLIRHLANVAPGELALRRGRLRDALSDFDAATIATTHEFCGLVLRSLGIAGDTDSGAQLVESLDDLVGLVATHREPFTPLVSGLLHEARLLAASNAFDRNLLSSDGSVVLTS